MIRFFTALILLLTLSTAHASQRRFLSDAEAETYRGVGRLAIAGRRFCTATLISDRLAITAAHCLYHPGTKRQVRLQSIIFVAGLRNGAFAARRRVVAATTPEGYLFDGTASLARIQRDLAVIELDSPIDREAAAHFPLADSLASRASIVSYTRRRAHAPSIDAGCAVRGRMGAVAAVACRVDFGASGAPVFVDGPGGPAIAAVVSATAEDIGGPVALSVVVAPLAERLARAHGGS